MRPRVPSIMPTDADNCPMAALCTVTGVCLDDFEVSHIWLIKPQIIYTKIYILPENDIVTEWLRRALSSDWVQQITNYEQVYA